jgi:hypothetical protein
MYYGARYYDRTVGLFVSPDTLVPDPTNVWDYNRYMYVRGNPLKYTDPTGHHAFCPTVGCSGMGMGERGGGGALLGRAAVSGAGVGVAAYSLAGTAQDLVQEQDRYVTPAVEPAGATILDQPLPVAASASTSFPLAVQGPETSVPASTGVFNDTLNVLAEPLPAVEPTGHVYLSWLGTNVTIVGTKSTARLRGYEEAVTELTGGLAGAQSLYESLTGEQADISNPSSLAPTSVFIQPGKIEVRFRPTSASGTPVIEVVNHGIKTYEKIHFNE